MHQAMYAQVALAGLRLLGQQVALKSLVPAYFTSSGNPERLLSARVGLYLWHVLKFGMAKVRKKMYCIAKKKNFYFKTGIWCKITIKIPACTNPQQTRDFLLSATDFRLTTHYFLLIFTPIINTGWRF